MRTFKIMVWIATFLFLSVAIAADLIGRSSTNPQVKEFASVVSLASIIVFFMGVALIVTLRVYERFQRSRALWRVGESLAETMKRKDQF
jgi:hypothetical protein